MSRMIQVVRLFIILLSSISISHGQVTFCAVGDILLDRGIKIITTEYGKEYPFECIRNTIHQHDLAMFNLESPLSTEEDCFPLRKKHTFRGDPKYAEILKNSGFNIASIANNHTIDCGKTALLETMEYLKQVNIIPSGAGENQEYAQQPSIIVKNGQVVAVFSFLEFLLESTTYHISQPYPAYSDIYRLCDNIKKVKRYVDNVIISFHWGKENSIKPTSRQIEYAHKLIDAGADLIIGHHPHVLQTVEKYKSKYIFYSLGNFIFDQKKPIQNESIILSCKLRNGNISEIVLHPIEIVNSQPKIADWSVSKRIYKSIKNNLVKISSLKMKKSLVCIENKNSKAFKSITLGNTSFAIYTDSIVAIRESEKQKSMLLPIRGTNILDAVGFSKNDTIYIYSIIHNIFTKKSTIALFSYVNKTNVFLTPSLDTHQDFFPWKIIIADVDNDGQYELLVGVYKKTKYFQEIEKRLFVYNLQGRYFYPKWFGSKINHKIQDFEVDNVNNDLIILHNNDKRKPLIRYKWNGFGFFQKDIIMSDIRFNEKDIRLNVLKYVYNYRVHYL